MAKIEAPPASLFGCLAEPSAAFESITDADNPPQTVICFDNEGAKKMCPGAHEFKIRPEGASRCYDNQPLRKNPGKIYYLIDESRVYYQT